MSNYAIVRKTSFLFKCGSL